MLTSVMTFCHLKFRKLVCWDGKGGEKGVVKNKWCRVKYIISFILIAMKIWNTKLC
jgi:hypothetical protein